MHSKPKNIRNYGIEILRMIMSFLVIIQHYYKSQNLILKKIHNKVRFNVPTFLIISFYFLNNSLVNWKVDKIKIINSI